MFTFWRTAALGAALMAPGCGTTTGRDFTVGSATNIHPGVTTREQVVGYLGQPYTRATNNGAETWTYTYSAFNPRLGAQAFVPFVGGMLPGAFNADTQSRSVNVTFERGIVATCQMSTSSGQSSSGGGFAGVMTLTSPSQTTESSDCFRS